MVSSEGWGPPQGAGSPRQRHAPRDFPLQTARDQDFHNFVSAGIKTPKRLGAISMRNRVFAPIAMVTEPLPAALDDFNLQFNRPILGAYGADGVWVMRWASPSARPGLEGVGRQFHRACRPGFEARQLGPGFGQQAFHKEPPGHQLGV